MDAQTALIALGLLVSFVTGAVSVLTRLAVAELRAEIVTSQEQRCKACESRFVSRPEYRMLLARSEGGRP